MRVFAAGLIGDVVLVGGFVTAGVVVDGVVEVDEPAVVEAVVVEGVVVDAGGVGEVEVEVEVDDGDADEEGVVVDAVVVPVDDGVVVLVDDGGVVLVPELAAEPGVVDDGAGVVDDGGVAEVLAELVVPGVVLDGVVPGAFVSGAVDAVPQISSLDSLSAFVCASDFAALGVVAAGVVGLVVDDVALGVVAAGAGVVVVVAGGFVPAFDSCSRSSFSLFWRSAISESLSDS
jgi:hypothetical protein